MSAASRGSSLGPSPFLPDHVPDRPHALVDRAGRRWPVVSGVPFLREGREALAAAALARLDAGDESGALALLLGDQDDWFRGERASEDELRALAVDADRLTLREAMARLRYGPVADYFAHRWSDPTFLAGLALMEAHLEGPGRPAPRTAFELACGIGQNLRALADAGVAAAGADVVFSKLWLARRYVVGPDAALACFDAARGLPVAGPFDLVLCHDAFYFLEPKGPILDALRGLAGEGGWLAVGHVHNRAHPNLSSGAAVTAEEIEALFPDAVAYDDAELTRALAEARAPVPAPLAALAGAEAFSLAAGPGLARAPRALTGGLALPPAGRRLVRNPLYGADGAVAWPSPRYAAEYGPRATYPARSTAPDEAVMGAPVAAMARARELVDLPERW